MKLSFGGRSLEKFGGIIRRRVRILGDRHRLELVDLCDGLGVLINRVKIQREVRFTVVELAHPHTAVWQATVHLHLNFGAVNRRFAVDKHFRRSDTLHGLRVQQLRPGVILHLNRGGVLV